MPDVAIIVQSWAANDGCWSWRNFMHEKSPVGQVKPAHGASLHAALPAPVQVGPSSPPHCFHALPVLTTFAGVGASARTRCRSLSGRAWQAKSLGFAGMHSCAAPLQKACRKGCACDQDVVVNSARPASYDAFRRSRHKRVPVFLGGLTSQVQ